MAHPFFDSGSYPWVRADARAFQVALAQTIPEAARINNLYRSCGLKIPLAAEAPDIMWQKALDALAAATLLRVLGDRLRKQPGVEPVLLALAEIERAVDPLTEPGIISNTIFVDRDPARTALGDMGTRASKNGVLLVRGGAKSGKTWTLHVVKEQADSLGEECIYLCAGLIATAEDALEMVFAPLDGSVPPKLTTDAAWYQKASTEMMRLAGKKQQRFWIVVDDLGATTEGPLLDDQIRELIDKIALNMINPAFARWFRLVLIDYPDKPVPTKWKGFWLEDRPSETHIQADKVAHFMRRWADRKKQKVLSEDEALKLAQTLLGRVDAPTSGDSRPRLERIHDELEIVLDGL